MNDRIVFTRREVNLSLLATAFAFATGGRASAAGAAARVALFDFAIAGGFFYGLKKALPALTPGTRLDLMREPDNPYDGDAIAVYFDGEKLGFIPRAANTPIARLLDMGSPVHAEVTGILGAGSGRETPGELVFTSFMKGDPVIRLSAEEPA